ncbi:MAG: right-handed parallel beta-helix repeat-containing protein, partial [Thermoplasmata archaeon]
VVYQNFIGNDVVNAEEDVLELRLIAKGKAVHVESLSVANASVSLPKKELSVNEEVVVYSRAKVLEQGKAFEFALRGVATDVPYRIVGNGGKAYYGSLPSGIVIDGAFGDWQGVEKDTDGSGDAGQNIDLREYASAIAGNAYFYMAVDGTMLAGCEIPVLGARPPVQPGPPMPVVIKENLGMDVARVYIDLMNSTINTFNPAMIQHGYLIELQGRNGQVISAKAWKWENGVKGKEIQNPNIDYGLSDGKIEFSVAGSALAGLNNDTKFYFEMTNWLGEKDASEIAYRAGKIQHQNTIANGGTKGTPHAPIHINGNSQFTGENGVVGGSGTQSDPYIISGWEIDANGGTYAIWIENTTAYFVIRNCNVYRATGTGSLPNGAGIALNNVTHGTIENNKCNNSIYGIYLYGNSRFNIITDNNVSGNSYGVQLTSTNNTTLTFNTITNNLNYGLYLETYSTNNTIAYNNVSSNSNHGIYIYYYSTNNTITNNNVSNNSWDGIRVYFGCSYTEISGNNVFNNTGYGISVLMRTSYCSIERNTVFNNNLTGIYVNGDPGGYGYTKISRNVVYSNGYGGSTYYGIALYWCVACNVTENKIYANNNRGIYMYYNSGGHTIIRNNVSDNKGIGICLGGSQTNNNKITYNLFYNNSGPGVFISINAYNNVIHHNSFWKNNGSATRGVNGNPQARDIQDISLQNYWYEASTYEGNYWSNWDGSGWGTPSAYPVNGTSRYDMYPISMPVLHPLNITTNEDFAFYAMLYGWPGNGTKLNPYIIDGYYINGNGTLNCTYIANTDVSFVIQNCLLKNATQPQGNGIYLFNVNNATLFNNTIRNARYGIYLGNAGYTEISKNDITGIITWGITLSNSMNITVSNNRVYAFSNPAIYLWFSNSNQVVGNQLNNTSSGIYLYSSSKNT